ncbi:hypothetical protein ANN_11183 [Periplaneta americana]|uniref:Uncharacterized protein n=1 Tax=Periplaneta americana TaxID=6978 RepID=A0ABQ8T4A1_PERAM|nr:hypothetical protein ANN_11183 [Periplaneta americana]
MENPRPSLYYFVLQLLRSETERTHQVTEQLEGHSPPCKNKCEDLDKRIYRIIERCPDFKEEGDMLDYLRTIGHDLAG